MVISSMGSFRSMMSKYRLKATQQCRCDHGRAISQLWWLTTLRDIESQRRQLSDERGRVLAVSCKYSRSPSRRRRRRQQVIGCVDDTILDKVEARYQRRSAMSRRVRDKDRTGCGEVGLRHETEGSSPIRCLLMVISLR